MLAQSINSKPYLRVNDVRIPIMRSRPTFLSQSVTVISKSFSGIIGGGLFGYAFKEAFPFIKDALPTGLFSSTPEYILKKITPFIFARVLVPVVSPMDALPIKLAGLGGILLGVFTFYQQRNLFAQANAAMRALGYKDSYNLVTTSDLQNINQIAPSFNLHAKLNSEFTVVNDLETNDFINQRETNNLLDDALEIILNLDILNNKDQMQELYQELKKRVNDQTIMNYFCTKTWLMDNEEKSHLTKFILNNNLELPKFYATKETSGNNSPSELNTQDDKDKMKQANGWVLQAFAGH